LTGSDEEAMMLRAVVLNGFAASEPFPISSVANFLSDVRKIPYHFGKVGQIYL
jgi:hypothetical protein